MRERTNRFRAFSAAQGGARRSGRDPDRYSIKGGGGCLMLFGLPFFLAGLAVMTSPIWGSPKMEGGGDAPLYFILPFGLVFAAVGAGLMFGRAGLVIDRRTQRITKWWGLIVPFKSTSFPMDEVKTVTISREVRTSHSSKGGTRTYTVFLVRLAGFEEPLVVEEPHDCEKARSRAEEIAKFLDVGVEDASSGEKVTREAGTLDESLRERVARTGEKLEKPEEPPGCRVASSVWRDEAVFDIPPKGFGLGEIIMIVVGLVFMAAPFLMFGGFLLPFFSDDSGIGGAWPILLVFGAFMLVWVGGIAFTIARAIASATAREKLSVNPREIRLERRTFLGTKTKRIPAEELEDLEVTGSSVAVPTEAIEALKELEKTDPTGESAEFPTTVRECVVARSDATTIEFGRGLSGDELAWLRDVVRMIVTSPK